MTTTSQILDALLDYRLGFIGARWNFPLAVGTAPESPGGIGQAVSLTYTFPGSLPAYDNGLGISGFAALTASQITAAQQVFAHYSSVAQITFSAGSLGNANIAIAQYGSGGPGAGSSGYGYGPAYSYSSSGGLGGPLLIDSVTETTNRAGDVWINSGSYGAGEYSQGGHGYSLLLHEIGHALGFKHPFEGAAILPSELDHEGFTVMAYNNAPHSVAVTVSGTSGSFTVSWTHLAPRSLMVGDMLAMQTAYGANNNTNTGNNNYTWLANERFFETIWDAAGTDTINASNQTLANVINLNPGSYSSIALRQTHSDLFIDIPAFAVATVDANPHPDLTDASLYSGLDNLGIAYGANIENAIGGSGNDTITGSALANTLTGNAGNDVFDGGGGNDTVSGGDGNDTLTGGAGNDNLDGGTGSDTLDYSAVSAALTVELWAGNLASDGNGGADTFSNMENLSGGSGNDFLAGNFLGNVLAGGAGNDRIYGYEGDDTLAGGAGSDTLVGGTGSDTLSYSAVTVALTAELWSGTVTNDGNGGTDSFFNMENLSGGTGNDFLAGNFFANRLEGGAGNDQLYGYEGDDTLAGGAGNDTLVGGTGNDTLDYSAVSANLSAELWAGTVANDGNGGADSFFNMENLTGGSGNDFLAGNFFANRLEGGAGNDQLYGYEGDDTLVGGAGNDTLVAGTGVDTLDYSAITGNLTAELWRGQVLNDGLGTVDTFFNMENLAGGSGNDLLSGDFFANRVTGNAGNDRLFGQEGNDTLAGGLGNDTLNGGSGTDQFVFDSVLNAATNLDTLSDFTAASDKLVLDHLIFAGLVAGSLNASNFRSVAGGAPGDADDFILYNSSTGALLYDADGTGGGAAVQFASLAGNPAITAADFTIL